MFANLSKLQLILELSKKVFSCLKYLSYEMPFVYRNIFSPVVIWRITYNGFRLHVVGVLKHSTVYTDKRLYKDTKLFITTNAPITCRWCYVQCALPRCITIHPVKCPHIFLLVKVFQGTRTNVYQNANEKLFTAFVPNGCLEHKGLFFCRAIGKLRLKRNRSNNTHRSVRKFYKRQRERDSNI